MPKSALYRPARFASRLTSAGCIGVGLWVVFATIINLDGYFVGNLDRVLPVAVLVRFAIATSMVATGSLGLCLGSTATHPCEAPHSELG